MVVNGIIWPKENVEPRNYRMHLLNGTDSRFMAIRFRVAGDAVDSPTTPGGAAVPFQVIGSDQGLARQATEISGRQYLLFEPGSRYDIVIDFSRLGRKRVIMENIAGDEPFGDEFGEQIFDYTDRVMAFDVNQRRNNAINDSWDVNAFNNMQDSPIVVNNGVRPRIRKVALFEGKDEFGRLQPLLGTAEPATDFAGNPINWPKDPKYRSVGLTGQMEGSIAWHSPTTENPALDSNRNMGNLEYDR